ncbi:MAG: undecaprenyl-diphosphatase [Chloroflexota bacterium]
MPGDVTVFVASYLVFIEVLLAALALTPVLWRQPRESTVRWAITLGIAAIVAYVLAQAGAAAYTDPRPFATDHVRPLIAHARDNGFPSDHALLAAIVVAAVLVLRPWWAIPFAVLAFLIDWARVGAGIHHVIDVVGSSIFVGIGTLVGLALAPVITRHLVPRLPPALMGRAALDGRPRDGTGP